MFEQEQSRDAVGIVPHIAHRRLVEMGVKIEAPPRLIAPMKTYDLWMVGFRDSEDNIMQLMSEVPRS